MTSTDEFSGTERYRVVRRLGAGGMGIVYEAFDTVLGRPVALKTLRNLDAAAIYRLKREFRALADVTHPGLATLHELVSAGGQWFIAMELVDGVDFLSWVRPGSAPVEDEDTLPTPLARAAPSSSAGPATAVAAPLDVEKLRAALRRLAEAVCALHAGGRLHRDIKPSNVLVTREARVVLLDFGLVTELEGEGGPPPSTGDAIVGTAAYMAPEQAAGKPVSPASDWYGAGAMLYQALTGRPPFSGSPIQVLMDKQRFEPRAPSATCSGVPADLDALCVELLRREPEQRPDGAEVLWRLGASTPAPSRPTERAGGTSAFVGREAELSALRAAFDEARAGQTGVVFLGGRSGIGKTALVRHFLDDLAKGGEAVVLAGRCYERESVPYKALDSLVDALARHLMRLPAEKVEALLPRDVLALARIFPVLRRVEAVAGAPRKGAEVADPPEQRRRAFAALRELLGRMADRAPLVLFIDDLQWGDPDSALLLAELLRPPDAPPLLLVVCLRADEAPAAHPLHELLLSVRALPGAPRLHERTLDPLSPGEARTLASRLLGTAGEGRVDEVARESGGNPFFVDELVRHVQDGAWPGADAGRAPPVSLDAVVRARLRRLPEPALRLLHVLAVAGRPLPRGLATRAAELGPDEQTALGALRSGSLVRSAAGRESDALETCHDRIRETVLADLPADRLAAVHLRVARTLEASGQADPEALALHFGAAGQTERAARYAAAAGVRAAEALAFDRAAAFYRRALELEPDRKTEPLLGDALANAGRGAEAAAVYLAAAAPDRKPPLPSAERLDLERRAAEQLLRSGHIDEGLEVVRTVLQAVGMRLAPSPRRALAALLFRRAHLALRGLKFRERDVTQVSAEQLSRVDVCWTVAAGLSMVDTIRGASFQTRHLLLALDAGEPYRIARAVAAEAAYVATAGRTGRARAKELIGAADDLAHRVADPRALGLVAFCSALVEFLVGNWREARVHAESAERIFHDAGSGLTWEAANTRLFSVWSLFYLGEVGELSRRIPRLLDEARERGDLYAVTSLQSGLANVGLLAADAPERARAEVHEAMKRWSSRGFHFQHYWGLLSHGMIDLYSGQGPAAWKRVGEAWPALAGSLLLRIQAVRVEATYLRARCALAAAAATPDAAGLVAAALRDARALEREKLGWTSAFASLVRAGAAASLGDSAAARAGYAAAAEGFERAQMALFTAAAKRRHGQLLGGDEGASQVRAADQVFSSQAVARPDRMVAMLAPCPPLDGAGTAARP